MENELTMLNDLIDPEVMADIITAKLPSAIKVTPFAKVDTTLAGKPGSTITVPKYKYIGDAEEVAEGVEQGTAKLEADTEEYAVKKVVKDVEITDEAVLSGYGNPVGEANRQLLKSIASKIDNDSMHELQKATVVYKGNDVISYDEIVTAEDLFQEEENVEKVMFISPSQTSTLRKDPDFTSNDKYNNNVIMKGEIGKISNTRIVPSKKIKKISYEFVDSATTGATAVTKDNITTFANKTTIPVKIGDYVKAITTGKEYFSCPIVQLRAEEETGDDELSALTIYLKRDTFVEKERRVKGKKTLISADKHYVAALTDESKVVLAHFLVAKSTSTNS